MSRRASEQGMSAVLLVIVFVIVTGSAAIMLESSLRGQKESGRQRDRALTISGADTAISRYAAALNAGLVNEQTRYQLRRSAYTAYGSGGFESYYGSKIILHSATPGTPINEGTANATTAPSPALVRRGDGAGGETDADPWGFDDYYLEAAGGAEASSRFTVEERPEDGGPSLYWQVFRVDPLILAPDSAHTRNTRNVDVVFRTWRAGTDPRYVKASFAAGRFGDYQVLVDEPIKFFYSSEMTVTQFAEYYSTGVPPKVGNAVTLSGKVHSNGVGAGSGAGIEADGVSCKSGTELSTSQGSVVAGPSCAPKVKSDRVPPISLGAVHESMASVRAECSQRGRFARCYPAGVQYDATISANAVTIRNRGNGALVEQVALTGRPMGLLFEDDVWVRQPWTATPASRLTILADSEESVANIHVVTSPANTLFPNLGTFGPMPGTTPTGLIAQGDVVIEAVNSQASNTDPTNVENCAGGRSTLVHAAVVAETGTLTVPPKWLSYIRQKATPACMQFALVGSLTVRQSPVLTMEWQEEDGGRRTFGYASRTYEWEARLQDSTPPYFPTTSPWGMSSWLEWNKDCVSPAVTLKAGC